MNAPFIHPDILARLLDGTLSPDEWEALRASVGEDTIRTILDGDRRLRDAMARVSPDHADADETARIMRTLQTVPAPNREFLRLMRYAPLIGVAVLLVGSVGMFLTIGIGTDGFGSVEIPAVDTPTMLWSMVVITLLGIGVWRMESA